MEPPGEGRYELHESGLVPAPPPPQWSRPVKGGTRGVINDDEGKVVLPQWSRPVKGGTSSKRGVPKRKPGRRNGAAR